MGKRSKKSKNQTRVKADKRKKTGSKDTTQAYNMKSYSVDQLLDKVDEYIDTFQYEIAQKFCQRALEMEPDNTRVLETSGILLLEVGEFEKAKQCFGRSIAVSPEEGHSKYMYMGQLMTGPDSIQYFMKGIELMKKYIEEISAQKPNGACATSTDDSSEEITSKDVSSAYCSVAEIYLTDECFQDEAENHCAECLDNALKEDGENPEAHHLYASYWLSKDDKQKAKECIDKGLALWLPEWRERSENSETAPAQTTEDDLIQSCSLSYPARINVTKILVELQDFDTASEICELLLDEDDEVVETWYLLGWIHHLQGEDFVQNSRYYLGKAQKLAKSTKCEDKDLVKHINELLDELGGPVEDDPDEVDDGADGEEMEVNSDCDEQDSNTMEQ